MPLFNEAVSLKLKPELFAMFMTEKIFLWLPTGFGSPCVMRRFPLCSTTKNKAVLAVVLLTVV